MSQARSTLVSPTEHALIIQANELIKAKKVKTALANLKTLPWACTENA